MALTNSLKNEILLKKENMRPTVWHRIKKPVPDYETIKGNEINYYNTDFDEDYYLNNDPELEKELNELMELIDLNLRRFDWNDFYEPSLDYEYLEATELDYYNIDHSKYNEPTI